MRSVLDPSHERIGPSDIAEALALLPHLRGKTVLDVGGGDGWHCLVWRMSGFLTTIMDNAAYGEVWRKRFEERGIALVNQDFYACDTSVKYDTVISMYAMNPEGALDRELQIANMRVINMLFLPERMDEWSQKKQQYIEWLDKVIYAVEHSGGAVEAHMLTFERTALGGRDDLLTDRRPREFSLRELREEWLDDRMCMLHEMRPLLIVLDKKSSEVREGTLPASLLRRFGYHELPEGHHYTTCALRT